MTAEPELLPCPFCGTSNQDRWPCEWLDGTGANVIRCAWCHGAAPASTWNRRTAPPSAPVGVAVASLPKKWRESMEAAGHFNIKGSYMLRRCAEELEAALAQQPTTVDGARELLDAKVIDSLIVANEEIHAAAKELAACLADAVAAGATDIPLTHRAGVALKRYEALAAQQQGPKP